MMSPEMMKLAQEQMAKMSPEQIQKMQEMQRNLDPATVRQMQEQMKTMDPNQMRAAMISGNMDSGMLATSSMTTKSL